MALPDRPFPPAGPLLVVSPHLDDAALSCAALLDRPEPVDVLTVFAGMPDPPARGDWDQVCGFPDSTAAVTARLAEDRAAFAGTPHRLHRLHLFESQYLRDPREGAESEVIGAWIDRWLQQAVRDDATVALPACAGRVYHGMELIVGRPRGERRAKIKRLAGRPGRALLARVNRRLILRDTPVVHGDHRFVRDAALRVLQARGVPGILLYEEVPYLSGKPADDEVNRVAAATGRTANLMSILVDREAKARRIGAYRSQIDHLFTSGRPLDDPVGLPPMERYWLLAGIRD